MRQSLLWSDLNRQPDFYRYPKIKKDHPMNQGLFGWWTFNNPRGSGVIKDIVQNNDTVNTNTDSTAGWQASPFGSGFAFDGVNDHSSVTLQTAMTLPLTMAVTFKITTINTYNAIFSAADLSTVPGNNGNSGFRLEVDNTNVIQLVFGSVAVYSPSGLGTISGNTWYRAVMTVDANLGTCWIYLKPVNGGAILAGSISVATYVGVPNVLGFGHRGDTSDLLTGVIADAQYWTRVISAAEATSYLLNPYGDAYKSRISYAANNRTFAPTIITFPPVPSILSSLPTLLTM